VTDAWRKMRPDDNRAQNASSLFHGLCEAKICNDIFEKHVIPDV